MRKTTKKKIAPVIITAGVLLYMVPLIGISLLAMGGLAGEGESGVTLILLTYAVLGGAVAFGIVKALLQRLDEIDGGEEEEASQY